MNARSRVLHRYRWLSCGLGALGCASACQDPLTDPTLIAGPRIIGARVSTQADAAVAEPAAGEAARIDWLVASNGPGVFMASVVWCEAAPSVIGAPHCDGSVFAESRATGAWGEPFSLEFSVPSALGAGSAWLAWLGICPSGEAAFDPSTSRFRCAEGDALSGFYRGFVPDGVPNHNPSLADDALSLDGVAWPPLDVASAPEPGAACQGLDLPRLRADQPSSVGFELGGDDREPLEQRPGSYAAHERESLVYTHLASLPGLDRAFSAIDYDAQRTRFEVPFEFVEAAPGPEGTTLGFVLLVRDERGGVDWQQRRACLLPE